MRSKSTGSCSSRDLLPGRDMLDLVAQVEMGEVCVVVTERRSGRRKSESDSQLDRGSKAPFKSQGHAITAAIRHAIHTDTPWLRPALQFSFFITQKVMSHCLPATTFERPLTINQSTTFLSFTPFATSPSTYC